ncbi:hypothetical protein BZH12_17345 [Salmonella enterica]|nr:hypothetical protein [Salmonella enterica]EAY9519879.1 hypothetical protein [Salmonella enterica]
MPSSNAVTCHIQPADVRAFLYGIINFFDHHSEPTMKLKQKIVNAFVNSTHEWNMAMHNAIERKVHEGFKDTFPNGLNDPEETEKRIESMRTFYYQRMMNTASLLLTGSSLIIALMALVVAMVSIHYA